MICPYIKSIFFYTIFLHFRLPRFVLGWFLFRGMVLNGIPEFVSILCQWNSELYFLLRNGSERNTESLLLFCSTLGNSELFFLAQKGSKRNYGSLLLFLFLGKEFREFSVPGNIRHSIGNNHLFHLFRLPRNYYLVRNFQPH